MFEGVAENCLTSPLYRGTARKHARGVEKDLYSGERIRSGKSSSIGGSRKFSKLLRHRNGTNRWVQRGERTTKTLTHSVDAHPFGKISQVFPHRPRRNIKWFSDLAFFFASSDSSQTPKPLFVCTYTTYQATPRTISSSLFQKKEQISANQSQLYLHNKDGQ